jgi:membrane protease YdiL (CAAX protease family)
MPRKMLVTLLLGINVAIILIIILLPKQEWMNYMVVVFMGILAYLFHLVHVHFLPNQEEQKRSSINTYFRKVGFGLSLSICSMGLIVVIISLLGGFSEGETFEQFNRIEAQTANTIFEVFVLYGSSALAEETVFRSLGIGVLMIPVTLLFLYFINRRNKHIREKYDKSTLAFKVGMIMNILIALLFGFVHKDSPGFGLIPFMNIAVSGIIYGYIYLIQKDIISAWSMHFSWNLFQMFAGLPVSGKYVPSASLVGELFRGAKDSIIAGGSYGPEGSVITLLVQLCLVAILFKYYTNDTNG